MDDARATHPPMQTFAEEFGQDLARVLDLESVQVDLQSDRKGPAPKIGEYPVLDAWTCEEQIVVGLDLGFGERDALVTHRRFDRAWTRYRRWTTAKGFGTLERQRLGILDLFTEELAVGVLESGFHELDPGLSGQAWNASIAVPRSVDTVGMSDRIP
jgi:hypothetical protein